MVFLRIGKRAVLEVKHLSGILGIISLFSAVNKQLSILIVFSEIIGTVRIPNDIWILIKVAISNLQHSKRHVSKINQTSHSKNIDAETVITVAIACENIAPLPYPHFSF